MSVFAGIDPTKLEQGARRRLEQLVGTDRHRCHRALIVAVIADALSSVSRGATDRDEALAWVNDETDQRPRSFATMVEALDEDVDAWRSLFNELPARPRGRQLPSLVCAAIAGADDPAAFIAFYGIPCPDPRQLERIREQRYGRRSRAA